MRHRRKPARGSAPASPEPAREEAEVELAGDEELTPQELAGENGGTYVRRDGVEAHPRAGVAEMVERREVTLGLIGTGAPRNVVVRSLRNQLGLSKVQAEHVYDTTLEELREEYDAKRTTLKAEQVHRLRRDLAAMRTPKKGQAVPYRAIAQHEALLARVTGTVEPVRAELSVDATVREAFVAVVGNMGRDEAERLIEEQLDLEARANGDSLPSLLDS